MNNLEVRKERKKVICDLEEFLLDREQVDLPIKHAFLDGAYFRQMTIPKDTVLTGKVHSDYTVNMITKGKIAIVTETGEKIITAPAMFVTEPGIKKAGYTLEDTIFINGHITFETDIEKIEEEVTEKNYNELENNAGKLLCLGE